MAHPITKAIAAVLSLLACVVVAGCETIDFDNLPSGKFSGTLIVMWVGEGGKAGDGKFVFVPDPHNRLSFTRGGVSTPIVPGVMYTDGGSVPKVVQPFRGFNPWGYAPAYMVHDWIFTAHHCISDGKKDPAYLAMADIDFYESGVILGEAIQTLMAEKLVKKNDVAKFAITTAVLSPVARNVWDAKRGVCDAAAVKPEHLREIELAVPGSTTEEARRRHIDVEASVRTVRRPSNAVVVGRVSFDRQL
ncbi:hypothetical protein ELH72_08350 [Rhizobium ruizarguesonis]|jgi:hypothetical protein|uniref:hypothetical protein n=1 Tax=Rhizobium ruizarguesonis TaxID=2081791 RepID=UPI0010300D8C|nr:hypothetical protein [Rhizobium ruizarguesonis]TAZ83271.1 hypothetical protein ELH72_08350 [Rhizobium ruizarguesonis]